MDDPTTYTIIVKDCISEGDLNATVEAADAQTTRLRAHTAQAGMSGLLRHLNGRGVIVLAVTCAASSTHQTD